MTEQILQTVVTALSLGSLYALAALGIGLLFGILRLVNFAYGTFITIGAYALILPSSLAMTEHAWGRLLTALAIVAIVVAVSLASEATVFRRLRKAAPATMMIASFALGYMLQNLIIMIYGSRPKAVGLWSGLMEGFALTDGISIPKLQFFIIGMTVLFMAALALFLNRTSLGVQMRAAAEDFQMARMLGVRANRVIAAAFAISGVIAAASSLILIVQTGILNYEMGVPLMLFGFISTVIGGMGSLVGTVLGGYIVGVTSVLLQTFLPTNLSGFRDAIVFALVILILIFRPQGLLASPTLRERV